LTADPLDKALSRPPLRCVAREEPQPWGQLRGEGLAFADVLTVPELQTELPNYWAPCTNNSCKWRLCQPWRHFRFF